MLRIFPPAQLRSRSQIRGGSGGHSLAGGLRKSPFFTRFPGDEDENVACQIPAHSPLDAFSQLGYSFFDLDEPAGIQG